MNPAKKLMLALTLSTAMALPTAGAFGTHTNPHRNFAQRHPIITGLAGAAVVHHFLHRRH